MEFTFEYNNGELILYHGKGKNKKKVTPKNLGWSTSHQFSYVAGQLYKLFEDTMRTLSREPDYDGKTQGLVGRLTLELEAPFSKEFMKKLKAQETYFAKV